MTEWVPIPIVIATLDVRSNGSRGGQAQGLLDGAARGLASLVLKLPALQRLHVDVRFS